MRLIFSLIFFLIFANLLFSETISIDNFPDKVFNFRMNSEKAVSYYLSGDYELCITTINESISEGNQLLWFIKNEAGMGESEFQSILARQTDLEDKSLIVTTIRRNIADALKAFVTDKYSTVLSKLKAVIDILTFISKDANLIQAELKKKEELAKKLSVSEMRLQEMVQISNQLLTNADKERYVNELSNQAKKLEESFGMQKELSNQLTLLKESQKNLSLNKLIPTTVPEKKTAINQSVVTNYLVISNEYIVTQIVSQDNEVADYTLVWVFGIVSVLIIAVSIFLYFFNKYLKKKRIKEISDLL